MMKRNAQRLVLAAALLPVLAASLLAERGASGQEAGGAAGEKRVAVLFTGGYETDPQDRGRPVNLVAGALGVAPEVFRAAFRNVRPAPAGQEPDPAQVRRNKEVLLQALGRYGITNERLDAVSNYYRYNPRRGEMWPTTPAAAYATVRDGAVVGFTITNPGSGYCSPPEVSVPGVPGVRGKVTLAFNADFRKNGAISTITVESRPAPSPEHRRPPRRPGP